MSISKCQVVKVTLVIALVLLLTLGLALTLSDKPSLQSSSQNSQAFYSTEGTLLRMTLSHDEQYRLWLDLEEIPDHFQKATLQYEDQYFYSHFGVNVLSLLRATYTSYFTNGRQMGASTITMQLARLHYRLRTTTVWGKLSQIWHALILERHYSKKQMLEAYLNLAPYGHNIQGIAAASLTYFHKDPKYLTTAESLLLAVIPQHPNARLLSTSAGLGRAMQARERLINTWSIDKSMTDINRNNLSQTLKVHSPSQLPYQAPHFVDQLIKEHGKKTDRLPTTLSLKLQHKIEHLVQSYVEKNNSKGLNNAAVMVLDYTTMGIKAEVGSVNYFDTSISGQVNGTRALRSPGSTLKPFIYALGLEQGLIHPSSLLKDTPNRFNAYTPENYDKQFVGPLSARDALVRSRNIPAVTLMQELEKPNFHEWLSQTSPQRLEHKDHYGLSLALGGNEVSMLELLQWYAALANHGQYNGAVSLRTPKWTELPHKQTGTIDTVTSTDNQNKSLLSAEASFLTLEMLSSNPSTEQLLAHRSLNAVRSIQRQIPWKTGTSFAFRDAWSIGVVGNYVVGVWVGNFDGSANPALIGRKAAGPLLFEIVRHLQFTKQGSDDRWRNIEALNLTQIEVCATSGDLDIEHCPDVKNDWFIPGVSPFKSTNVFRDIPIDVVSGLRACREFAGDTQQRIFEFWPSDVAEIFRSAGIAKKRPPAFVPECSQSVTSDSTDAPVILSPNPELQYALQADRLSREKIPLMATVASDTNRLFWFIDNEFVGQTRPDTALLWNPKQGEHRVTVIDDFGRSSEVSVHAVLVN